MKLLMLFVAVLLLGSICQARLGEIEQQSAQRFGPPTTCHDPGTNEVYRVCEYQSQGLEISVHYGTAQISRESKSVAGLSLWESYTASQVFSETAVEAILDANKGTSTWSRTEEKTDNNSGTYHTWKTKDGTRFAKLFVRPDHRMQLNIVWLDVASPPKGF